MLDTNNYEQRKVKTPIGDGLLVGNNEEKEQGYLVSIRRENCTEKIAGPNVFRWFTADELEEVKA